MDGIWACYEQNGDKREYFDRVTGLRLRLLNDMQVEKLPGDSVLSAYRGVLQKLFIGEKESRGVHRTSGFGTEPHCPEKYL
ncbi:MAG: hypothetical protein V8S95_13205 [Odoribacter sp.]